MTATATDTVSAAGGTHALPAPPAGRDGRVAEPEVRKAIVQRMRESRYGPEARWRGSSAANGATPANALRDYEPFLFAADGTPLIAFVASPAAGQLRVRVLGGICEPSVISAAERCAPGCGCACHGKRGGSACGECAWTSHGAVCFGERHGGRHDQWVLPRGAKVRDVLRQAAKHAGYERCAGEHGQWTLGAPQSADFVRGTGAPGSA